MTTVHIKSKTHSVYRVHNSHCDQYTISNPIKALHKYFIQKKIPGLKHSVDPDQLASDDTVDQDPHCPLTTQ